MTPERFQHLLSLVGPFISKRCCRSRQTISAAEQLVIVLCYLATGDSQQSQSVNFRVGRATICKMIKQTCYAIWQSLQQKYLKPPSTKQQWKEISKRFEAEWNFPNCLGALDGKDVAIECPRDGGSNVYNYKGFHSLVLSAICDDNYCFTLVDIGGYGRDNDAAIFSQSEINTALEENLLDIPEADIINGFKLPYVFVSDEIFPVKSWLLKPYPGRNLDENMEVFNYRLSRCRRTIENTFGVLAARWRILQRPIRAYPETVEKIIMACVCLHNYLKQKDNACYVPGGSLMQKMIVATSYQEAGGL